MNYSNLENMRAAAARTAATSAKNRIKSILTCEEAKDREAHARTIALTTDIDVYAARSLLATLPKSWPKSDIPPLSERAGGFVDAGPPFFGNNADPSDAWARSLRRVGAIRDGEPNGNATPAGIQPGAGALSAASVTDRWAASMRRSGADIAPVSDPQEPSRTK